MLCRIDDLKNKQVVCVKDGCVLGFISDVEIDTLTIKGNAQTFYLLDKSLHNTHLKTLAYTKDILLDISGSAINNEYVEVTLWNGTHI